MNPLKPLLSLLFVLSINTCFAQWSTVEYTLPNSPNVDALDAAIVGYDTLKISYRHSLYNPYRSFNKSMISNNNGETWNNFSSDKWCYFYNSKKVYGIKADSLFYSSNAGASWQFKSVVTDLNRLDIVDEHTLTYVTYQGQINVSNNYGATWTTVSLPSYLSNFGSSDLLNFYPISEDRLKCIVGAYNGVATVFLIETTDGGSSWDSTRLEIDDYFDGYHNKAYAPNDTAIFRTGERELLIASKNNTAWDSTSFFATSDFWARPNLMSFKGDQIIVACTSGVHQDSSIAISNDFGKTWQWQTISGSSSWSYGYLDGINLFAKNYGIGYYNGYEEEFYLFDGRCPEAGYLGSDMTICDSVMMNLSEYSFADSIKWNDGDEMYSKTLYPGVQYIATIYTRSCAVSDTILISMPSLNLSIPDTAQCGGSVKLQADLFDSYLWSNGSDSSSAVLTASGEYTLTITKNGCSAKDTFKVDIYALPGVSLADTSACATSVDLNPGNYNAYSWNTGAQTPSINVQQSGSYSVTVTDGNGCMASDSAMVNLYTVPVLNIGPDTALCADSIVVNVLANKDLVSSYTWSTGDTSDIITFNASGFYWLSIVDTNGCAASDSINVTLNSAPSTPSIMLSGSTIYSNSSLLHTWYLNGSKVSGETDSVLNLNGSGTYYAIVTDNNGCVSDSSNHIMFTAGIYDLLIGSITAYPNPSHGGINLELIDLETSQILKIELLNVQGQRLHFNLDDKGDLISLKWNISPQPIWLVVTTEKGSYRKLIIEN